jgi:predicted RNA-binding Zn ribbon-like protein
MDDQLPSAGSIHLLGGRLCLDFANTADWHASATPVELLRTYADLVDWSVHAGTLTPEDAQQVRELANEHPAAAQDALMRARELRETLFRLFATVAHGTGVSPADLALLNGTLATALTHRRITNQGADFAWRWHGLGGALDGMLWPVALSAAELLAAPDCARVGICADEHCGWLFLDTSKSGRRRWCSMEGCGNRAKARRHYRRQRATGAR